MISRKSDGSDVRFSANGKEIPYWIEEWDANAKKAKIWVKVPLIPANGGVKIEMWYGNPSASSSSNGDAVFELFDDYTDENKWVDGITKVEVGQKFLRFHSESVTGVFPMASREFSPIDYDVVIEWTREHDTYTDLDKSNEMFYIVSYGEINPNNIQNRVAQIGFNPEKSTNPCNPYSRGVSVCCPSQILYSTPNFYQWYIFKINVKFSKHRLDYFIYDGTGKLLNKASDKNFWIAQ